MGATQKIIQLRVFEHEAGLFNPYGGIAVNRSDRIVKPNNIGTPKTTMKLAVLANRQRFGEIAVLVKQCPIIGCAVGCGLTVRCAGHALAVRHEVRGPGKGISSPVVFDHTGNRAFTLHMRPRSFGNPTGRSDAISSQEGDKWSAGHLDADVSGRAYMDSVGEFDKNHMLKILAKNVGNVTAARVHDDDLRRSILLDKRTNGVTQ